MDPSTKYDPEGRHRRSIRLKGYDYSQSGAYFLTVVTQDRMCLFGEIANGEMKANDAGRMVLAVWKELSTHYLGVEGDEIVVMPNHIHGVVILVGAGPRACPDAGLRVAAGPRACPDAGLGVATGPGAYPDAASGNQDGGQPQGVAPTLSLPDVMHRFKTLTTKLYADGVKESGWPPFRARLWQRNYYEHIVRNDESLDRIRQYILDNPARWEFDQENPSAQSS